MNRFSPVGHRHTSSDVRGGTWPYAMMPSEVVDGIDSLPAIADAASDAASAASAAQTTATAAHDAATAAQSTADAAQAAAMSAAADAADAQSAATTAQATATAAQTAADAAQAAADAVSAAVSALLEPPTVEVSRVTSDQAIAANVHTAIIWNYMAPSSDAGMWSASTPQRLIAPRPGRYFVTATVVFQNTGNGASDSRGIRFRIVKGGVTTYARSVATPAAIPSKYTELNGTLSVELGAGDWVEVQAESNIALNIKANEGTRAVMEWRRN